MNYSEKLKDPRWQKKRLEILSRDNFTCTHCGDDKTTLHVHHLIYSLGNPWEIDNKHLTTLCEPCHSGIHKIIGEVLISTRPQREITADELLAIDFLEKGGNPQDIPHSIFWHFKELVKYKNLTSDEYQRTIVARGFLQDEWVRNCELTLHKECLRWTVIFNDNGKIYGEPF